MEERTTLMSNKMISVVAIVGFSFLLVIWYLVGNSQTRKSEFEYGLEEHWDVYIDGAPRFKDCSIAEANFGTLDKGTVLDMYVELPEELDGGYSVDILVYLCSLEAYLDDELIYSYGTDEVARDVMVGSGHHFIQLPDKVAGKRLQFHMVMNEDNAFANILTPKCAKTGSIRVAFARTQLINTMIGMFLMVLGATLAVVAMIAVWFERVYTRLIYIGWFAFFMGAWTLLTNKSWQIFSNITVSMTTLEYATLFFAPVPFGLLMYDMRKHEQSWRRTTIVSVLVFFICFASVTTLLHVTNIVRYPEVLVLFHVVIIVGIAIMVVAGYFAVQEKTESDRITVLSAMVMMFILIMDVVRFNLQKYWMPNNDLMMNSIIPLGTLVFVIMLLVSYLIYLYRMVLTKQEKESLTDLAYHDALTGLLNRTKYEEDLDELENGDSDFAIISMDVNGLKEVNDNLGHGQGDKLLTGFAEILSNNFGDIGACYRIGGDEYMVIVDAAHIGQIHHALLNFTMDESDASQDLEYNIQASYGVAYRSETESGQAYKVYRLADQRMYEMKSEVKGKNYSFGKA